MVFLFKGTYPSHFLSLHTHIHTHGHTQASHKHTQASHKHTKSCTRVLTYIHAHTNTEWSGERFAGFKSGCIPGYNGLTKSHTHTHMRAQTHTHP